MPSSAAWRASATRSRGLDMPRAAVPDWLWPRWVRDLWRGARARRIAATHLEEPPLDLTRQADPEGWAGALGGDRSPDRLGAALLSGPDRGPARLRRRRLVGAGRRRGAAGAPPRDVARQACRRPLRRARRQDRGSSPRPAPMSPPSTSRRAAERVSGDLARLGLACGSRRGRHSDLDAAGNSTRSCSMRPARDRHHPSPPRHRLARSAEDVGEASPTSRPHDRPGVALAEAGRHAASSPPARSSPRKAKPDGAALSPPRLRSCPIARQRSAESAEAVAPFRRRGPCLPVAGPTPPLSGLDGFFMMRVP